MGRKIAFSWTALCFGISNRFRLPHRIDRQFEIQQNIGSPWESTLQRTADAGIPAAAKPAGAEGQG